MSKTKTPSGRLWPWGPWGNGDPAVTRLRGLAPFAACSEQELAFVAAHSTEHHAKARAHLARQNEPGHEFVVLTEGHATVMVDGFPVARLGPGDCFGEIALIDHGQRTADVIAETDVVAVVASAREFDQILRRSPTVIRVVLGTIARRLRDADRQVGRRVVAAPR